MAHKSEYVRIILYGLMIFNTAGDSLDLDWGGAGSMDYCMSRSKIIQWKETKSWRLHMIMTIYQSFWWEGFM